jgi:hypothetical protein
VSDDLLQSVNQTICERWNFRISEHSCEFPQISCTLLYEIITVRLSQVLCKMGSKNAHEYIQNAKNGFGFDFFIYHEDGDEFLNHIA